MAKRKVNSLISGSDKKLLIAFGDRVRDIRVKKKKTVYDLTGDDMPIKTRQHWQWIENGKKNINLTTVFKIARSLEVDADELLKGLK